MEMPLAPEGEILATHTATGQGSDTLANFENLTGSNGSDSG